MYCSRCGAQVAEGAGFCSACGQRVFSAAADPAAIPVGVAQTAPPAWAQTAPGTGAASRLYAGFWLRVVAYIIDAIILGLVGWLLTLPFLAGLGLHRLVFHPPMTPMDLAPLAGVFFRVAMVRAAINWLYYALLESSAWQATLGKMALGLYVTDGAGRRISFARASGRFWGMIVSGIILCIGFIMAGFTQKKQALHDMMADCLVLRKV